MNASSGSNSSDFTSLGVLISSIVAKRNNKKASKASASSENSASSASSFVQSEASSSFNPFYRPSKAKPAKRRYHRNVHYHKRPNDADILYQPKHASELISESPLDELMKPYSVMTKNGNHRILYRLRTVAKAKTGRPRVTYKTTRLRVSRSLLRIFRNLIANKYNVQNIKALNNSVLVALSLSSSLSRNTQDALADGLSDKYKKAGSVIRKIQAKRDGQNANRYNSVVAVRVNQIYKLMLKSSKVNRIAFYGMMSGLAILIKKLAMHSAYDSARLSQMLQSNDSLRMLDDMLNSGDEARHRYNTIHNR